MDDNQTGTLLVMFAISFTLGILMGFDMGEEHGKVNVIDQCSTQKFVELEGYDFMKCEIVNLRDGVK